MFETIRRWFQNQPRPKILVPAAQPPCITDEEVASAILAVPTHFVITEQIKERTAVAAIAIGTVNSTTLTTGNGINMGELRRARAYVNLGAIPGGGNVNVKLRASATSGGTFSDITGMTTNPTITGCLAGPSCIEIRADQMPSGKPWLRLEIAETGGQTVTVDGWLLGDDSAHKPGNQFNTTTLINDVVAAT